MLPPEAEEGEGGTDTDRLPAVWKENSGVSFPSIRFREKCRVLMVVVCLVDIITRKALLLFVLLFSGFTTCVVGTEVSWPSGLPKGSVDCGGDFAVAVAIAVASVVGSAEDIVVDDVAA